MVFGGVIRYLPISEYDVEDLSVVSLKVKCDRSTLLCIEVVDFGK